MVGERKLIIIFQLISLWVDEEGVRQGQAAPHPHQHPLQEGSGGPGGQGLGTGKGPLIVVLFCLVGAASPWGRWRRYT